MLRLCKRYCSSNNVCIEYSWLGRAIFGKGGSPSVSSGERGDGRREAGKAHGLFEKKKGFNGTRSLTLDFNNLSKHHSGRRRVKEEDLWGEQRGRKRK